MPCIFLANGEEIRFRDRQWEAYPRPIKTFLPQGDRMKLYAGSTTSFVLDATRNRLARLLESAFVSHYRYKPSPGEVRAWEESLTRLGLVISGAKLEDHGIFLEYQLPLTSRRLDALITGEDRRGVPNAVIVELKQWQKAERCDAEAMVSTWVGGGLRDTLHPSVQAGQYRDYLADMNDAFYEEGFPVGLSACSYLHNYRTVEGDPILDDKFKTWLNEVPLYDANRSADLEAYLGFRLENGKGLPILKRIEDGKLRPSKKLLDHVAKVVAGEPRFVLLDEQRVVFERALAEARRGASSPGKRVLLVQGGPGTGKSVLAANLLGRLSADGLNAQYATGSKAFTQTMRRIVGRRAGAQFRFFNSYTGEASDTVDVLICDESHRIREKSTNQFTPAAVRASLLPQVDELLKVAKVSVFFIDDRQVVRPGENGSARLIREHSIAAGAQLWEYRLEAQFRCAGSDAFVNWVDNTLGIQPTANQVWNQKDESFEFRVFSSVEVLDQAIRERAAARASARLTAGFCWPWSNPNADGTLVNDVVVGEFRRPWNAKSSAGRLARGIPPENLWAYDPAGIEQVGCIYTAQGFEFDYVGVIWSRDLRYDQQAQRWIGDRTQSQDNIVRRDGDAFVDLVKNTYRVLLSRGLKGCYVYCQDTETAKFLLSRAEGLSMDLPIARAEQAATVSTLPPRVPADKRKHYMNCIPVYDLRIAAGSFGEFQVPDPNELTWVEPPEGIKASMDVFIAQVVGESMNKIIPNGAWCLFRMNPAGSRKGRIVLAQLRDYSDPEHGGAFTVKRYMRLGQDGESEDLAGTIQIQPMSTDPRFIRLDIKDEERIRVIAEFLRVL